MTRGINHLLWIGLVGTLTIGSSYIAKVYSAFRGEQDIWWTPQSMRVPFEDTKSSFELYLAGQPLRKHLADGTLFAVDRNGQQFRVASEDITARMNNWDKTKASFLTHTTITGVAFGVTVTILGLGLGQVIARRRESGPSAAQPTDTAGNAP